MEEDEVKREEKIYVIVDNEDIRCSECSCVFSKRKNLYAHLRRIHKIEKIVRLGPTSGKWNEQPIKCSECSALFTQKKNLYAHSRRVHKVEPNISRTNGQWNFSCIFCSKLFSHKSSLLRHNNKFHQGETVLDGNEHLKYKMEEGLMLKQEIDSENGNLVDVNEEIKESHNQNILEMARCSNKRKHEAIKTEDCQNPKKSFKCIQCSKWFSQSICLKRHMKRFHGLLQDGVTSTRERTSRLLCPHEACIKRFSSYAALRTHLSNIHSIEIETETREFKSLDDFNLWRVDVQQSTLSSYLCQKRKQLSDGTQKQYFDCHRSYFYKPKGRNIRKLSRASYKIGKACPSRIEVSVLSTIGDPYKIKVKFWKTHCGHQDNQELQSDHVFLRNESHRAKIAEELEENVSFTLDSVQDDDLNETILLQVPQDLNNDDSESSKQIIFEQRMIEKAEYAIDLLNKVKVSQANQTNLEKQFDNIITLLHNENIIEDVNIQQKVEEHHQLYTSKAERVETERENRNKMLYIHCDDLFNLVTDIV